MGLLDDILAGKRSEIRALRAAPPPARPVCWPVRDAARALGRPVGAPLRLIAEIKLRSPSAGLLSRALGPSDRAKAYQRAGAAMISVLTDARWFDGAFDHLAEARRSVSVPLLAKDFVVDPIQIDRAWSAGADAVLVIVRCVPAGGGIGEIVAAARDRGIEPLLEVVDETELQRALAAGARLVGVNARDLDTLAIDVARAARVLARIPPDVVGVHFSGLHDVAAVATVAASGADAALIGEALMRADDPEPLLRAMVAAAGSEPHGEK